MGKIFNIAVYECSTPLLHGHKVFETEVLLTIRTVTATTSSQLVLLRGPVISICMRMHYLSDEGSYVILGYS